MTVRIEADGLARIERYIERAPEVASKAAALALNQVAERDGIKILAEGIEDEIDFPDGYVAPRIYVKRKAYNQRLEVVLASRHRPTSLARFAKSQTTGNRARAGGVKLNVNPGRTTRIDRGFLVRLRAGKSLTDDNFNLGLAVRLREGEKVTGKRVQSVDFQGGLTLLYGPSVNQVMRDVADERAPELLDAVDAEFIRQFNRLSERI